MLPVASNDNEEFPRLVAGLVYKARSRLHAINNGLALSFTFSIV